MGRLAVAAIVSLWVVPISILVNRILPDPYMVSFFVNFISNFLNLEFVRLNCIFLQKSIEKLTILIPIDVLKDEIFHVPQAQKYCSGNFRSWDPMITTPPGLYVRKSIL